MPAAGLGLVDARELAKEKTRIQLVWIEEAQENLNGMMIGNSRKGKI